MYARVEVHYLLWAASLRAKTERMGIHTVWIP